MKITPVHLLSTLALGLTASCASVPKEPEKPWYTKFPPPPHEVAVSAVRLKGGDISVEANIIGQQADSSVFFAADIFHMHSYIHLLPGDRCVDSIDMQVITHPTINSDRREMTLTAQTIWPNSKGEEFEGISTYVLISTVRKDTFVVNLTTPLTADHPNYAAALPISTRPEVEWRDSVMAFSLIVKRLRWAGTEHATTYSVPAVQVRNKDGEVVWKTDNRKRDKINEESMIEPFEIDLTKRYEVLWNGILKDGSRLPKGSYDIDVDMLSTPIDHLYTVSVEWDGNTITTKDVRKR